MWPDLPIEFSVAGTPVSLQSGNARAKAEWKAKVLTAARTAVPPGSWALQQGGLAVTLFYFPQDDMVGDIDNIAKLVLDALQPNIYGDDQQIDRLVVQRFPTSLFSPFAAPSDVLVTAMARTEPTLYIRIAEAPTQDIPP